MSDETRRALILATIDDLVANFLYYDRKEDEELPQGDIEAAITAGEITDDDIVDRFKRKLLGGLR